MSDLPRHGVFPLPDTLPADCRSIDLSDCDSRAELLQRIGSALDFPDWYDANFDALFDCLVDAEDIACLAFANLQDFAARHAEDFTTLTLVLGAVCDVRAELGQPVSFFLAGMDKNDAFASGK